MPRAGPNCFGVITSGGDNLENPDQCAPPATGDQIGVNPLLGALGDYGGPTDTMALRAGQPRRSATASARPR